MIVYHGSYISIEKPDIFHSRDHVDFGKGFYITPIKDQAVNWAKRFRNRKGTGVVSVYEVDLNKCRSKYRILEFDGYTAEWLDYITMCRQIEMKQEYDVVIGGVANDKVFNTIELYFEGLIDKYESIRRLRYEKPNLQMCICNQKLIEEHLHYVESEEI